MPNSGAKRLIVSWLNFTLKNYYYYLTAIWLTPGGSSTAHIYTHKQYTKYRGRNTHNNYKEKKNNYKEKFWNKVGSAGRAPSLPVIPWHLPYN
jgi:hypothetical protein